MIYIPSKWSGHHHEIYRFKGVLRGAGDIGIGRELLYVTGMIATCHGQFGQSKRDIHQPLFMVIHASQLILWKKILIFHVLLP